jgi:hypothetical protein
VVVVAGVVPPAFVVVVAPLPVVWWFDVWGDGDEQPESATAARIPTSAVTDGADRRSLKS